MRIDDGCSCSSLFMLLKRQDGGSLCVGESAKSLSFSQSDFLREESLFAVPSSPLCIMTCFLWTPTACLHLLSLLGHLNARRLSCVPRTQLGPPCTTYARGTQALTHRLPSLGFFPLPGQPFPHFSTFLWQAQLSLPWRIFTGHSLPSTRRAGSSPVCVPHNCEQTSGTKLPWGHCAVSSRSSCLPLPLDFCILSS